MNSCIVYIYTMSVCSFVHIIYDAFSLNDEMGLACSMNEEIWKKKTGVKKGQGKRLREDNTKTLKMAEKAFQVTVDHCWSLSSEQQWNPSDLCSTFWQNVHCVFGLLVLIPCSSVWGYGLHKSLKFNQNRTAFLYKPAILCLGHISRASNFGAGIYMFTGHWLRMDIPF
jgi:hypothetical protein